MSDRISSSVIGVLGEVFNDAYTHSNIDRLFGQTTPRPDGQTFGPKVKNNDCRSGA